MEYVPLFLLLLIYLLVAPLLGILATHRVTKVAKEQGRLAHELLSLRQLVGELRGEVGRLSGKLERADEPTRPEGGPKEEVAPETPTPPMLEEAAAKPGPPADMPPLPREPQSGREVTFGKAAVFGGLEERLTSGWLVWLGAVAIALGGAFLVRYSIERGWLGPITRVTLGFILGVALVIGGEWLRRRPGEVLDLLENPVGVHPR